MIFNSITLIALATSFINIASASLPAIEIVGNKFFFSNNGSQFYMRGIAYQADTTNTTGTEKFVDPLANPQTCKRDIPYLTAINTNVIRVYALNYSVDHSECIKMFDEAGIYIIADVSQPSLSINRANPSWTVQLFNRYKSVVDELSSYTNILGFFAGNEVTNDNTNTDASPFVKAAVRDTKAYIKQKGYRKIPVGYSSNDDADTRVAIADYFTCGSVEERADFYGINMYEWCGQSTFQKSGYQARTQEFKNITVPVFFSEYGCNEVQPRKFTEVQALYGSDMTGVWSGGIVYMYYQEANNYGLVTIQSDGAVSTMADYGYYSKEINSISPSSAKSSEMTQASATLSCPSEYSNWKGSTNLPPTPDDALCSCMVNSLSCVAASDVSSEDYSKLFGAICGQIDCSGITANGTTGKYGAYSFCSPQQQLSFVLNLYYLQNGKNSQACNFSGSATLTGSSTTASQCSSAFEKIGSQGLGSFSSNIGQITDMSDSGSSNKSSNSNSTTKQSSVSESSASFSLGKIYSVGFTALAIFLTSSLLVVIV